jgi:hypothetical protein
MENKGIFTGSWRSASNSVKVRLSLIMFNEDDTKIMYCPALEVSGYGKSEPEARESFEISLDQFLEYSIHKKTLSIELEKLGWKLHGKYKPAHPPTMQQLLEKNENFNRIFNDHPFKKIDE